MKDFRLTVSRQFSESLTALTRYHESTGSTWLNEELFTLLVRMEREYREGGYRKVRQYVFELWDVD